MKYTLLLIFIIQFQFVSATKTDSISSNEANKNEAEVNKYKAEVSDIYKQYQDLQLYTLETDYKIFLSETEKSNPDLDLLKTYVNKFEFYHNLKLEESSNLERTSDEYFKLSAKVFQYKSRVQNLFIDVRGSGSFYGGLENQKQAIIQKKRLYEAGMLVYDTNMQQVKNTNPCDPASRIIYLSDNMKMLIKMEKLLMAENTRGLEKSLKNLDDIKKIKELIYSYKIN